MADKGIPSGFFTKREHDLPHWQVGGGVYFITFRAKTGSLPVSVLSQVKKHVLYDLGRRYELFFGVVMPDHVHLLIRPLPKPEGGYYDLAAIMKGIKGASARTINRKLEREGPLWQKESFDRIIRDEKEYEEKLNYMWNNPVKAELVKDPPEWEFFVSPTEKQT